MANVVEGGARAAALLREVRSLGPARVVLRSCSGFMELFCDVDAFQLDEGWLNVRQPGVHLHVPLPALEGACLLDAGGDAYPHAPSIWFLGRCGSPCLLMILDLASGDERVRQAAAFRTLQARWGERIAFDAPEPAGDRVIH
jgi:hypothetical protein